MKKIILFFLFIQSIKVNAQIKNGPMVGYSDMKEVMLWVQTEKTAKVKKPRMASIPKEVDPSTVTVEQALLYLSLPRVLGINPANGKEVIANKGRFGPYIGCERDFRSLKTTDVYKVTLEEALGLLAIEKKKRGFQKAVKSEEVVVEKTKVKKVAKKKVVRKKME